MRIAYCFSGHLRRFWDNRSLQEQVIGRAPGDLFVHTWNTLNSGGVSWHGDTNLAAIPVDAEKLHTLQEQFGPFAKIVVDPPPQLPGHLMPTVQSRCSFWRANSFKCDREKELGIRYDVVVNLRFDLMVHEPFAFPKAIEPGVLYCLNNRNCVDHRLCCDILNFGSSRTMDLVSEIFQAMCAGRVTAPTAFSGERFLTTWCAQQHIPFRYWPACCSLLRPNGSLLTIPRAADIDVR